MDAQTAQTVQFILAFVVAVSGGVGAGLARSLLPFSGGWLAYAFGLLAATRFRVGGESFDALPFSELAAVAALSFGGAFLACVILYLANDEMERRWNSSARLSGARPAARAPFRFAWGRGRFSPAAQAVAPGYARAPRRPRRQ